MKYPSLLLILLVNIFTFLQAANPPKHEIRGVWLTTIYGLDWPSKTATNERDELKQKLELCEILDRLQDANFNTVFLQVRMRGDLIYPSQIEPAGRIFTGKYGTLPSYDPLAYAIEECHKRGLECHAWVVTFPLGTQTSVKQQGNLSLVKKKPHLCKQHNGEWYMDPGIPETTEYIVSLAKEIVTKYDIDGIHFDYIRYPEQAHRFPDKKTHNQYGKNKPLADWRRENINKLVDCLYTEIKQLKPWVQVSSSPLGKYSRTERVPNAGWTAYESVYQDPKKWMEENKHDMVVPMMYYLHDNFFPFVDNWVENSNGRLIVPGLGAYRLEKEEGDWEINDLTDQIDYSRQYGTAGCTFFRAAHIMNNTKGIYDQLKNKYYNIPALQPPLWWLDETIPSSPTEILVERISDDELKLSWESTNTTESVETYTVYYTTKDSIDTTNSKHILITGIRDKEIYLPVNPSVEIGFTFSVSASTRYHIESQPSPETFYYFTEYEK